MEFAVTLKTKPFTRHPVGTVLSFAMKDRRRKPLIVKVIGHATAKDGQQFNVVAPAGK
jgi:hypothetical protein